MRRRFRLSWVLLSAMLFAVGCDSSNSGSSSGGNPAGPSQTTPSTRYVAPGGRDAGNNCLDANNPCVAPQHAHDESKSGDTIEVKAGRYDGALVISRAVVFKGESRGTTTLAGGITVRSDLGSGTDARIIDLSITPGASGSTTGVTLEGLRLNGLFQLKNVSIAGFSNRGLDAVISDGRLIVESSSITGRAGSDDGINIRSSAVGSAPSQVELTQVTVSGHGADGVQFSGIENIVIIVKNSLFERNGQAGVQIETMNNGSLELVSSCVLKNGQQVQQAGISLSGINVLQTKVESNNIEGNNAGGAEIDRATPLFNMTNNWWGKASGPSVTSPGRSGTGDSVSPGITFSPFATSAIAGTPCT